MTDTDKTITIKSLEDFKQQLVALKNDAMATLISYYKYCWLHDSESDFNYYRELIEEELNDFGLKDYQYRVTEDMNFVFRYKKKAEAVMYIKHFGVDVFFHKR